jgi:hypothetical protein
MVETNTLPASESYEWPSELSASAEFWGGLRVAGFEIPTFSSVEAMADWATMVIVGVPVGSGPSVTLQGDPDNNETYSVFSIVVEVKEIVRSRAELYGITPVRLGDRITVIVDRRPRGEIPDAPVLLFLESPNDGRYNSDPDWSLFRAEDRDAVMAQYFEWETFKVGKFELVNSQSVLIGDAQSTVNPFRPPADDPLAAAVSGRPISEIVELVRSMPPPSL